MTIYGFLSSDVIVVARLMKMLQVWRAGLAS
jgi:hypothetical protein